MGYNQICLLKNKENCCKSKVLKVDYVTRIKYENLYCLELKKKDLQ